MTSSPTKYSECDSIYDTAESEQSHDTEQTNDNLDATQELFRSLHCSGGSKDVEHNAESIQNCENKLQRTPFRDLSHLYTVQSPKGDISVAKQYGKAAHETSSIVIQHNTVIKFSPSGASFCQSPATILNPDQLELKTTEHLNINSTDGDISRNGDSITDYGGHAYKSTVFNTPQTSRRQSSLYHRLSTQPLSHSNESVQERLIRQKIKALEAFAFAKLELLSLKRVLATTSQESQAHKRDLLLRSFDNKRREYFAQLELARDGLLNANTEKDDEVRIAVLTQQLVQTEAEIKEIVQMFSSNQTTA